jgi:hypothetical protein
MRQALLVFVVTGGTSLVLASSSAQADDLSPPYFRGWWWDGAFGPSGSFHQWEFSVGDSTAPDLEDTNPGSSATLDVVSGPNETWRPNWGGREGVWPLSGEMAIEIADAHVSALAFKYIDVQLTWAAQEGDAHPSLWELSSGKPLPLLQETRLEPTGESDPAGEYWYHSSFMMLLYPNPDREFVRINGCVMVDELVIDTWSFLPEPGVAGLLGLGGLLAIRYPARRRSY